MAKKSRLKAKRPAIHIDSDGARWIGFPIYTDTHLDAIARAARVQADTARRYRDDFEKAAAWFRLDDHEPKRTPPSTARRKIANLQRALDKAVVLIDDPDVRDAVKYESERQGGNFDAAVNAAADLAAWTKTATPVTEYKDENGKAKSLAPRGHVGDAAINDWLAEILSIYERVTGCAVKVSVGSTRKAGGRSYGPLVRFIQACAAPLSIKMTDQKAFERTRSLIRQAKGKSSQKNI